MKIRSITYFSNVGWPIREEKVNEAGIFLTAAKVEFQKVGFEVQTTRLATIPFENTLGADLIGLLPRMAQKVEALLPAHGIDYASLGPVLGNVSESFDMVSDALAVTKNIFFSGVIAEQSTGINLKNIKYISKLILENAKSSPDGFTNLRFTALANVRPGSPFFPAAYHSGDAPTFAIAVEAADLALMAFDGASSLEDAADRLRTAVNGVVNRLNSVADNLKYRFGIRYGGIDFSLAPHPDPQTSIGAAVEKLGIPAIGLHGSLAAAGFIMGTLDKCDIPRAGFSGLMYPVLEDSTLAKNVADGVLSVKDLLLYASVCGSGLDTVPVPGDVSVGQLSAVLLDVAVMSLRLNKQLTARLLPIPGKVAGDETSFKFDYFVNSKVMALESQPLGGLFAQDGIIQIAPRADQK